MSTTDINTTESQDSVTRIDISAETTADSIQDSAIVTDSEKVPAISKLKIVAALAVVAGAGYLAFWVQQPTQIKADVASPAPAAVATTSADTSTTPTSTGTALNSTANAPTEVSVTLFGFDPATVSIKKGDTVKWNNVSSEKQTIVGTANDGTNFTSQSLSSGDSFTYTFTTDATVDYYSTYNPAVKAKIIVGTGTAAVSTPAANDTTKTSTTDTTTKTAADATTPTVTAAPSADATPVATAPDTTPVATATTDLKPAAPVVTAESTPVATAPSLLTPIATTPDCTANTKECVQKAVEDSATKHPAAVKPNKLAKSGPEDMIYVAAIGAIAFFNRRRLLAALK